MKKNRVLFILPSILYLLLISIYPIFKILIDVKKIENTYLSIGCVVYLLLYIIMFLSIITELIYLLKALYKSEKSIIFKIIWTFLLVIFNVFTIPYFYIKYVLNDKKAFISLIYVIPLLMSIGIFFYGSHVYNEALEKINIERKKIEDERNIYSTKDNMFSVTFRHGYTLNDVGEYDMYVINREKNIVFTAFSYNIDRYEQKSADDFINKGINDVQKGKEKFDIYKDKEVIDLEDKTITTISYLGKTKESSLCLYKISAVVLKSKPNYLLYVVEVTTEKNYKRYENEINEILEGIKLNG